MFIYKSAFFLHANPKKSSKSMSNCSHGQAASKKKTFSSGFEFHWFDETLWLNLGLKCTPFFNQASNSFELFSASDRKKRKVCHKLWNFSRCLQSITFQNPLTWCQVVSTNNEFYESDRKKRSLKTLCHIVVKSHETKPIEYFCYKNMFLIGITHTNIHIIRWKKKVSSANNSRTNPFICSKS